MSNWIKSFQESYTTCVYKNFIFKVQKNLYVLFGKANITKIYLCSLLSLFSVYIFCVHIFPKNKWKIKHKYKKKTRRTNKSALIQIYRLLCALFLFTFDLYTQSQVDFVTRLSFSVNINVILFFYFMYLL